MNGDLAALRATLPSYAGHADAPARRLSDQQVRGWIGESLVDLQDRIPLESLADRFDALLIRCEFGDQHVIKALESDAFDRPDAVAAVEAHDAELVAAAGRLKTVAAGDLGAAIEALERAFDARADGVTAALKR